jgi:hypothetical protein
VFYRTVLQIPIFPIGQPGFVKVKCHTRQINPETEWAEFAEFPLFVVHQPVEVNEETKQAIEAAIKAATPTEADN